MKPRYQKIIMITTMLALIQLIVYFGITQLVNTWGQPCTTNQILNIPMRVELLSYTVVVAILSMILGATVQMKIEEEKET